MIIKSLSRKSASYSQLIDYMQHNSVPNYEVFHNVYRSDDPVKISEEFQSLGAQLPLRKNGNMLYHEILSLKRQPDVEIETQKSAIYALAQRYLLFRAPGQIAYGCMHIEREHLHIHLMISPNRLDRPTKRVRLPKASLLEIQRQMETFLQETYPRLNEPSLYVSNKKGKSQPDNEYQYEKRTGKKSKKTQLKLALEHLLAVSSTTEEFEAFLSQSGLEFYQRGKIVGVVAENTRYRLQTLGLEEEYKKLAVSQSEALVSPKSSHPPLQNGTSQSFHEERIAELAKLRLENVLRDILKFCPDQESLIISLQQYGLKLESRGTDVWCSYENTSFSLSELGLEDLYESTWLRVTKNKNTNMGQQPHDLSKESQIHTEILSQKRCRELDQIRSQMEKSEWEPEQDHPFAT